MNAIKYHKKRIKDLQKFIDGYQEDQIYNQLMMAREDLAAHKLRLKELEDESTKHMG